MNPEFMNEIQVTVNNSNCWNSILCLQKVLWNFPEAGNI
jgi:hypothetical protein